MLALEPKLFVVRLGSEFTISPWSDHEIRKGSSPLVTVQIIWTNWPSSRMSCPRKRGIITGGSVTDNKCDLPTVNQDSRPVPFCSYNLVSFSSFSAFPTVYSQFHWLRAGASLIWRSASINTTVSISNRLNCQHACSGAKAICCQARLWIDNFALQRPGDW